MKSMKKQVLILCFSSVFLASCDQVKTLLTDQDKKEQTPQVKFEAPKDQYGLRYRVGNLGGKKVKLSPTVVGDLEYNDSPGWDAEAIRAYRKNRPTYTYDSIITSFGFKMRYSDGLLYELYYKVPRKSEREYDKEHNLPESKWISVGVKSGKRFGKGDMNEIWRLTLEVSDVQHPMYIYHATGVKIYDLEEYAPSPYWRKDIRSHDYYVHKDQKGDVTTIIDCSNGKYPTRRCQQRFLLTPDMKVLVYVRFRRKHLQDWQLIKQQATKVIKSYVIE